MTKFRFQCYLACFVLATTQHIDRCMSGARGCMLLKACANGAWMRCFASCARMCCAMRAPLSSGAFSGSSNSALPTLAAPVRL